jgi:hypothetical protein
MASIKTAVSDKHYRLALERTALRLAELLDNENLDDKIAAGIAREMRIVLEKLGIETDSDTDQDSKWNADDKL